MYITSKKMKANSTRDTQPMEEECVEILGDNKGFSSSIIYNLSDTDNMFMIFGDLNRSNCLEMFLKLKEYIDQDKKEPFYIFIECNGGDTSVLYPLIELIVYSKIKIITIGLGRCFSGACDLLLSGDEVYCSETTLIMEHATKISFNYSMAKEARSYIELADKTPDCILSKIKNKKRREFIRSNSTEPGIWLNGKDLKEQGIIDGYTTDLNLFGKKVRKRNERKSK